MESRYLSFVVNWRSALNALIERAKQFPRPWRQIRWKLTLSYTVVTVGALLVVELFLLLGLGAYSAVNSRLTPRFLIEDMSDKVVPVISRYLSQSPLDAEMLWLKQFHGMGVGTSPIKIMGNIHLNMRVESQLDLFLITADGVLLEAWPSKLVASTDIGREFDISSIPGLAAPFQAAMRGEEDYHRLFAIDRLDNRLVAAVPIMSEKDQSLLGVLAFTTDAVPWSLWSLDVIAQQLGYSLIFITLFAGLIGTLFGSLTAHGLVDRLKQLSISAAAWSQGDFSVLVDDPTGDELGHLAQDLNRMAQQLENLLDKRQEVSVMEERNRLARDLHDSAKQQAFAASAQLGAARALWMQDPAAAESHLTEAATLVDEVRHELTSLIQELRPASLQGIGLATALQEYGLDWANQTNIDFDLRIQGERPLELQVEQTLFRILQEALANVARHSQASQAKVLLIYQASSVDLTICDNGRGFDPKADHKGLGLCSMRERANLLSGSLTVESAPGQGTRLAITLPYPDPA